MTVRRMLLVAHTCRPDIAITACAAAASLAEAVSSCWPWPGRAANSTWPSSTPPTPDGSIEIVLAIGGDGTLLRAAEHARPLSAAVPGTDLGRVGFLTGVDLD